MAIIIPPGWGVVAHKLALSSGGMPSGEAVVTYGIHFAGTPPQDAVETCAAYFGSVVLACCSSAYDLTGTSLKVGPVSTGATYESDNTASGGEAGAPVLPQVALLVKKLTGIGGRSQRGRFYLPGIPFTSTNDAGTVDGEKVEDFQDAMDTFLAGLATEGVPMALLHSASSDPTEVTQLKVESKVATQRRRMR